MKRKGKTECGQLLEYKGTCHKLICFRLNKIKIGRQARKQAERAETEKKIIDS